MRNLLSFHQTIEHQPRHRAATGVARETGTHFVLNPAPAAERTGSQMVESGHERVTMKRPHSHLRFAVEAFSVLLTEQ